MKDGLWKNIDVVKDELEEVAYQWRSNTVRFKLEPWQRWPHVALNYLTETNRALPRTYTYLQLIALIILGVYYA